ncbi:class I SAM-dependent methyltransferase [Ferrovum myxofaciens]|uniref:class I SAM-dependent methyltransferase n=1 Tax=Ferrovum myxofaciens TaxID=416213 RepID=UPI003EBC5751
MDVRTNYEESWKHQRERETAQSQDANTSTLRRRLSQTRYQIAEQQILAATLPKHRHALIDIGCGRGEVLYQLGPHFERVVGVDVSAVELGYLAAELPDELRAKTELQSMDLGTTWPFEDKSFDVVSCLAVLEHLFDPCFTAGELARICKPEGHVVVEVPNIAFLGYRVSLLLGHFPSTSGDPVGWDGGHLHYFTIEALRGLFERVGLQIIEVRSSGLLSSWRSFWPAGLGRDVSLLLRREVW